MGKITSKQFIISFIISTIALVCNLCVDLLNKLYSDLPIISSVIFTACLNYAILAIFIASYIICGIKKVVYYSFFRFKMKIIKINEGAKLEIANEASHNFGYIREDKYLNTLFNKNVIIIIVAMLWVSCLLFFPPVIIIAARSAQKWMENNGYLTE